MTDESKSISSLEHAEMLIKELNLDQDLKLYQETLENIMNSSKDNGFTFKEENKESFHNVFAFGFKFGVLALQQALLNTKTGVDHGRTTEV